MEAARREVREGEVDEGAPGMTVTVPGEDEEEEEVNEDEGEVTQTSNVAPARKTKQQRRKAAKVLAEVRHLLLQILSY